MNKYETLDDGERKALLKKLNKDDLDLYNLFQEILQKQHTASRYIDNFLQDLSFNISERIPDLEAGKIVGAYQVGEEIGRGGMAVVYQAIRADGAYQQEVAVKVIKKGLDTDQVIRRFQYERQILADLTHPGIVNLLDAGVTEGGSPYFVMEKVNGQPITQYCQQKKLNLTSRILLFINVLDTVQFAHQQLIIHRDIKPSNIYVNEDGRLKLMDFGIAKILKEDAQNTQLTSPGQHLMTPDYASPEQFDQSNVSVASDVYQLGIMLYEMMTGDFPYQLEGKTAKEREHVIKNESPVLPSRRNSSFKSKLKGDLDNIILKALQKEPERRYNSVEAFKQDLENYLHGKPVQARANSFSYIAEKFIIRNKIAVIATSLIFAFMVSATVISLWQTAIANREKKIAEEEADKSRIIAEYLTNIFNAGDPTLQLGNMITANELVDKGYAQLTLLNDQPEIKLEFQSILAEINLKTGNLKRSADLAKDVINKYEEGKIVNKRNYVKALRTLATTFRYKGSIDSGEYYLNKSLVINKQGNDRRELAKDYMILAENQYTRSQYDSAEINAWKALQIMEQVNGKNHVDNSEALSIVAAALFYNGKNEEGIALMHESIKLLEEDRALLHPELGVKYSLLATFEIDQSNYREAIKYILRSTKIYKEVFNEVHPEIVVNYNILGTIYNNLREYDSSYHYLTKSYELGKELFGEDHHFNSGNLNLLARIAFDKGDIPKAKKLLLKAYEIVKSNYPEDHHKKIVSLTNLSIFFRNLGEMDSSYLFLKEANDMTTRVHGSFSTRMAYQSWSMANYFVHFNEYDQAVMSFQEAILIYDSLYEEHTNEIVRCKLEYAMNYINLNKPDTTINLIKQLKQKIIDENNAFTYAVADINSMLAKAYIEINEKHMASELLRENIENIEEYISHEKRILSYNQRLLAEIIDK